MNVTAMNATVIATMKKMRRYKEYLYND